MAEILTNKGQVVLVDEEDVADLNQFKWFIDGRGYVVRYFYADGKLTYEAMHRRILGLGKKDPTKVDHRNRNKIDNRRVNLRKCTVSQNSCNIGLTKKNTSGFKGVSWHELSQKWMARINVQRKYHYLGLFETKELAYEAYCDAAKRLHGEFACVA